MLKLCRLNLTFTREEYIALEARAKENKRSIPDHIRTLIEDEIEGSKSPLLDALAYDIIHMAVSCHHLVTLTGERSDLVNLAAEARRLSRDLGVRHDDE